MDKVFDFNGLCNIAEVKCAIQDVFAVSIFVKRANHVSNKSRYKWGVACLVEIILTGFGEDFEQGLCFHFGSSGSFLHIIGVIWD